MDLLSERTLRDVVVLLVRLVEAAGALVIGVGAVVAAALGVLAAFVVLLGPVAATAVAVASRSWRPAVPVLLDICSRPGCCGCPRTRRGRPSPLPMSSFGLRRLVAVRLVLAPPGSPTLSR